MIMDSVARRSEERLPGIFVTLAFLAAGVLLYARLLYTSEAADDPNGWEVLSVRVASIC